MVNETHLAAIILAAGQSKRMKCSKIVLPWGNETVISHIISVCNAAHIEDIVVVTGGYRELVEKAAQKTGVRLVFNPDYKNDEMITSLQVGLREVTRQKTTGFFLMLGDQPTVFPDDLLKMNDLHKIYQTSIIVPSYSMRRGHPWIIPSSLYEELCRINPPETLRTFMNTNEHLIQYCIVDHAEIMSDLDTREDYESLKPK